MIINRQLEWLVINLVLSERKRVGGGFAIGKFRSGGGDKASATCIALAWGRGQNWFLSFLNNNNNTE